MAGFSVAGAYIRPHCSKVATWWQHGALEKKKATLKSGLSL